MNAKIYHADDFNIDISICHFCDIQDITYLVCCNRKQISRGVAIYIIEEYNYSFWEDIAINIEGHMNQYLLEPCPNRKNELL